MKVCLIEVEEELRPIVDCYLVGQSVASEDAIQPSYGSDNDVCGRSSCDEDFWEFFVARVCSILAMKLGSS